MKKNKVVIVSNGDEGYDFSDIDKQYLEAQMRGLADGDTFLMKHVEPSRKTLGAKAHSLYVKAKRDRILQAAKRRLAYVKGAETRRANAIAKAGKILADAAKRDIESRLPFPVAGGFGGDFIV